MANSTPNINLSLMKTGENVGTWGNVLNTNFLTIDSLLGEMKEGRGTYVNIADHLKSLTDSINSNNAAIIKTDGELTALKGTVTSYKEEAIDIPTSMTAPNDAIKIPANKSWPTSIPVWSLT